MYVRKFIKNMVVRHIHTNFDRARRTESSRVEAFQRRVASRRLIRLLSAFNNARLKIGFNTSLSVSCPCFLFISARIKDRFPDCSSSLAVIPITSLTNFFSCSCDRSRRSLATSLAIIARTLFSSRFCHHI